MTLFSDTNQTSYGASAGEKRDALALDYLRAGKPFQWVLDKVCGDDNKAIARAANVAVEHRYISASDRKAILSQYRIDDKGRKVR